MKKFGFFIFLFCLNFFSSYAQTTSVTVLLNGKSASEKISIKSTGKLEIALPEGWRYISGKIKIMDGDTEIVSKQIVGETNLKAFDLLAFIKANAKVGNDVKLDLSVRTKESGTLTNIRIPIVE